MLNDSVVSLNRLGDTAGVGNFSTLQTYLNTKRRYIDRFITTEIDFNDQDVKEIHSGLVSGNLAIGTTTEVADGGYVAAYIASGMQSFSSTVIVDADSNILNIAEIRDGIDGKVIYGPNGNKVFGFIQSSETDDTAIGASSSWTAQLSLAEMADDFTLTAYSHTGPINTALPRIYAKRHVNQTYSANNAINKVKSSYLPFRQNTTLYVDTSGSDSSGHGTSGDPFATLAKAVNHIENKGIVGEILVKIHMEDTTWHLSKITLTGPIWNKVRIYGDSVSTTILDFDGDDGLYLKGVFGFSLQNIKLEGSDGFYATGINAINSYFEIYGTVTVQNFEFGILVSRHSVLANLSSLNCMYNNTVGLSITEMSYAYLLSSTSCGYNTEFGLNVANGSSAYAYGISTNYNGVGMRATLRSWIDARTSTSVNNTTTNYSPATQGDVSNPVEGNGHSVIYK